MDRVSDLMPKVLRQRGLQKQASVSLVIFKATAWIAEHLPLLKDQLTVQHCKDQILLIAADHPIAAQECQQRMAELLEYLQKECGSEVVQNIRLIRS